MDDFHVVLHAPERFTDPLAQRTDWNPLSESDSTAVEAGFNEPDGDRLSSSANLFMLFLYIAITLFGLLHLVAWMDFDSPLGQRIANAPLFNADFFDLVEGLFFSGLGLVMLFWQVRPKVFDRRRGWYYVGFFPPAVRRRARIGNRAVRLQLIHAVQLLTKRRLDDSGKGLQVVHELNLVLEDAARIQVFCHGDLKLLRQDALTISRFLSIPMWDAAHGDG